MADELAPKAPRKTRTTKAAAKPAARPAEVKPEASSEAAPVKRGPGRPRKTEAATAASKSATSQRPTKASTNTKSKARASSAQKKPKTVPSRTAGVKAGASIAIEKVAAVPRNAAAKAKQVVADIDVTPRQATVGAVAATGILAAAGAAFLFWRGSKADQPAYRVVQQDGDFEVREYPALTTASTEKHGPRQAALDAGFQTLADYIFAKSRPGEKIKMTAPVLAQGTSTSGWRTRFIMPENRVRGDLPTPPAGVLLEAEAPRRVAAVRFAGRADDATLNEKEGALRSWLQLRSLPSEAKAEHAFYNSPMTPGPLRRNEVLIELSRK